MKPSHGDARARAADVLVRVASDDAFAAPLLDAALDRAPALDPRDRALCTELVYGVLRTQPALDEALGRHARDGASSLRRLDPFALASMRVAAYQILALQRVPPSAAVDAAVGAVRRARSPGLAGFVNAVLRKLSAERPATLPDDARVTLALRSVPPRARARLVGLLGDEGADACLRAMFTRTPAVSLRVNLTRTTREALAARLLTELPGAQVTLGARAETALLVVGGGDPTRAAAWREGLFAIQEEGAQAVCALAEARPGMRVLDACAGVGGKSATLAMALRGDGLLHSADLFPEKLPRLGATLAREGIDAGLVQGVFAADLSKGLGALGAALPEGGYDLAMVDAPCSGLGTLAHRPDLLLRLRDDAQWEALCALQGEILARVADCVRPGGALVYAVCTLTREESDDVVARFRAAHPAWTVTRRLVLRTDVDGTDGFVAVRLSRAAST
ncbi:MAG: transcription antitermination factor NusB [Polyangiales bacterium]